MTARDLLFGLACLAVTVAAVVYVGNEWGWW